jgi:hypothetical protein
MSITFYPSYEWQMKEIPCNICDACDKDMDPFCTGTITEPDCPYINMANGNACAMLALLNLPTDECCGEVDAKDVPNVVRAIIKAQNVSARRQNATEPPYESGGPGTGQCKVISFGRNEDYITRRLNDLMDLLKHCQEKSCGFYWC